jgi:hypothetical protein
MDKEQLRSSLLREQILLKFLEAYYLYQILLCWLCTRSKCNKTTLTIDVSQLEIFHLKKLWIKEKGGHRKIIGFLVNANMKVLKDILFGREVKSCQYCCQHHLSFTWVSPPFSASCYHNIHYALPPFGEFAFVIKLFLWKGIWGSRG